MKQITVKDCIELRKMFDDYCKTAEQHEFVHLAMIDKPLEVSIEGVVKAGKVTNQKDIRAMFRVVLGTIGKDYSEYMED